MRRISVLRLRNLGNCFLAPEVWDFKKAAGKGQGFRRSVRD